MLHFQRIWDSGHTVITVTQTQVSLRYAQSELLDSAATSFVRHFYWKHEFLPLEFTVYVQTTRALAKPWNSTLTHCTAHRFSVLTNISEHRRQCIETRTKTPRTVTLRSSSQTKLLNLLPLLDGKKDFGLHYHSISSLNRLTPGAHSQFIPCIILKPSCPTTRSPNLAKMEKHFHLERQVIFMSSSDLPLTSAAYQCVRRSSYCAMSTVSWTVHRPIDSAGLCR